MIAYFRLDFMKSCRSILAIVNIIEKMDSWFSYSSLPFQIFWVIRRAGKNGHECIQLPISW